MEDWQIFIFALVAILSLFIILVFLLCYNIASGFLRGVFKRKTTQGSLSTFDEDSPWFNYQKQIDFHISKEEYFKKEEISIESSNDLLFGTLFKNNSKRIVIYSHGSGINGLRESALLVNHYHEKKVDVLVIVLRGHDKSGGKYTGGGILEKEDLKKWIEKVSSMGYEEIILEGISMGAYSASLLSDYDNPKIKGIILEDLFNSVYDDLKKPLIRIRFVGLIISMMFFNLVKKRIKINLKNERAIDHLANSKYPTLFIVGENENIDEVKFIYDKTANKKELIIIPNAYSGECIYRDTLTYLNKIDEFLSKI